MVQFLSINVFGGFLQFLLGFSKVSVFLCLPVYAHSQTQQCISLPYWLLVSASTAIIRPMLYITF